MATFYISAVSRALRSVQRVDLNYVIAAAVRTGDSLAEVRGHRLWISEGELGRPLAQSRSRPRGLAVATSPRASGGFHHPWSDHVPGCALEGLSQRHASTRGSLADTPANKRLVGGSRP